MISSMPDPTHSSTISWMLGVSTSGSISFGTAFVAGKNRVVWQNVAQPAEPQPAHLADGGARRHMEHRAVDPVELLADILDQ